MSKNNKYRGGFPWFVVWWVLTVLFLPSMFRNPLMLIVGALCLGFGIVSFVHKREGRREWEAERQRQAELLRQAEEERREREALRAEAERKRQQARARKEANFAAMLDRIPRVAVVPAPVGSFVGNNELQPVSPMNITRRTNIDGIFPLVAIDTETTGVEPEHDEIIEVSAIKFGLDFKPIAAFTTLCKPHRHIPAAASRVNNITDEMVEGCPYFEQVAAQFQEFIAGCNIVGHNIKFDTRILNYNGVQFGSKTKFFDTWELSKRMLTVPGDKAWNDELGHSVTVERPDVKNRKLSTVAEYYGIYRDDAHRSLSDCLAAAAVFKKQIKEKTF